MKIEALFPPVVSMDHFKAVLLPAWKAPVSHIFSTNCHDQLHPFSASHTQMLLHHAFVCVLCAQAQARNEVASILQDWGAASAELQAASWRLLFAYSNVLINFWVPIIPSKRAAIEERKGIVECNCDATKTLKVITKSDQRARSHFLCLNAATNIYNWIKSSLWA